MKLPDISQSTIASFSEIHSRVPDLKNEPDAIWLAGYEQCRANNAAVCNLMEQELYAWRNGQKQSDYHRKEARKLIDKVSGLERALSEQGSAALK